MKLFEVLSTEGPLEITPLTDGNSHINIYSKAKTQLGHDLSNFSTLGIKHPEYGRFASLEAYWYWLASGKQFDSVRDLTGIAAKRGGKMYPRVDNPNFEEEFTQGIHLRFQQHPDLWMRFMTCRLPYTHYYYFGAPEDAKVMDTQKNHWVLRQYSDLKQGAPLWVYVK